MGDETPPGGLWGPKTNNPKGGGKVGLGATSGFFPPWWVLLETGSVTRFYMVFIVCRAGFTFQGGEKRGPAVLGGGRKKFLQ